MNDTTAVDPRALLVDALEQLEKLLAALTPELLERPTPCEEFDLRTLLGHVVGAAHRAAYVGEGGRGLDIAAQVGAVADDDWTGALARVRSRVAAAWADDAKLARVVEVPWGTFPGRIALGGSVMEVTTHTWDVAQVIAPDAELDARLAEFALGVGRRALPADRRGAGVPFDTVYDVPADADAYTRLAGWTGRAV